MPHLVPQARLSRNLVSAYAPMRSQGRTRQVAARADLMCDYYLRLPPQAHAGAGAPPQFVQIAKIACPSGQPALVAPPVGDAEPTRAPASVIMTLGAVQMLGLASAVGSVLGGNAGAEVAKGAKSATDVADEVALALPGALLGGLTGLALAGRLLSVALPELVHLG